MSVQRKIARPVGEAPACVRVCSVVCKKKCGNKKKLVGRKGGSKKSRGTTTEKKGKKTMLSRSLTALDRAKNGCKNSLSL